MHACMHACMQTMLIFVIHIAEYRTCAAGHKVAMEKAHMCSWTKVAMKRRTALRPTATPECQESTSIYESKMRVF